MEQRRKNINSKEMPFKNHQKRKEHKQFTFKVFILCLSLLSIILFESSIVLKGKELVKSSTKNKKLSSFKVIEKMKVSTKLKIQIKRDIARVHKIIHLREIPDSHFYVESYSKDDDDHI